MKDDNWKHCGLSMKCGSCMWWIQKTGNSGDINLSSNSKIDPLDRCRRHAPTMNGFPARGIMLKHLKRRLQRQNDNTQSIQTL